MNPSDACECTGLGDCQRFGRRVTLPMVEECQRSERYRWFLSRTPRGEWPEHVCGEKPKPAKPSPPAIPPRFGCRFLGPVVKPCPHKDAARHVHACTFTGHDWKKCTPGAYIRDIEARSCIGCDHFQLPAPPSPDAWTRHLIYHVYPVSGNGAWQRNVGRLVERLRIFNGKRIVTIAIDPPEGRKSDPTGPHPPDNGRHFAPCDSPEAVIATFGDHANSIEFIVAENDPHLREAKTLIPMLERLPSGPLDCTLYAQAKGTTRHPKHIAQHWSDAQIILYADYWPLVAEQLAKYPVTGAFKKLGPGWRAEQHKSDWHYSGSWFWFRNADLFARDWRRIDDGWSAIEPYPSQQFAAAESGCLFLEGQVPDLNLYRKRYWRQTVDPALAQWRNDNVRYFNATWNI